MNRDDLAVKDVPPERGMGYLWPVDGQLIWFPPTDYEAPLGLP
jgi:hypothetical protein